MPPSGRKNKKEINLSQKRTCGRVDSGAGVYGGCYAYDRSRQFGEHCQLGFKLKDGKPLEPCYKPKTIAQLLYALKLRGM